MRAFKLISLAVAFLSAEKVARADEDIEVIDLDAPELKEMKKLIDLDAPNLMDIEIPEDLPEPEMPENPFGDIDLETIVRTGTLDGVNPPSTPE